MKIKPLVVVGTLVVLAAGAIAFLGNARFQEEKRQAGIAIAKDKAACQLKPSAEGELEITKYLAEKNPAGKAAYEEAKQLLANAEASCKKVADYEARYGSP